MKTYSVHSLFYTLQGEGANTGRPAVFCRFTGCNLWSGHEADRAGSCSAWCDTDFIGTDGSGGGRYGRHDLADAIARTWPSGIGGRFVVFTGGEPLLQLDRELIDAVHRLLFDVAVETNGTIPAPEGIDWLTVSPKAETMLRQQSGDELKFVYPQGQLDPAIYRGLRFRHFVLQPKDGPEREAATQAALAYCLAHSGWRLGLQAHKVWGIP